MGDVAKVQWYLMWKRVETTMAASLVEECEAFLAGHLLEHELRDHGAVTDWMYTNLLAHGTHEELLAAQHEHPRGRRSGRADPLPWVDTVERWRQARSFLAAEVLELASTRGPLGRVQQEVLVPLEHELAGGPMVLSGDPRTWVATVLSALDDYRNSAGRPGGHHHGGP